MDYTAIDDAVFEHHASVPCTIASERMEQQPDPQRMAPDLTAPPPLPNVKRAVYSTEDWEPFKALIEELWIEKNLTFRQLAKTLAEKHNFCTNKRQFDRIAEKWGLRKNVRKEEMRVIVQTQRRRAGMGKKTAVRIRGQELPKAKIARWEQRYKGRKDVLEINSRAASPLSYVEFSPRNPEEPERSRYYLRYSSLGIMDSPKLTRLNKALREDSEPDLDDVPPFILDSSKESSEIDQALDVRGSTAPEEATSMVLANTGRNSLTPGSCYVQTANGVVLVSEISPFPFVAPSTSRKASKTFSVPSLPYKRAEEMRYRYKLLQMKQNSVRDDAPEFLETLMQLTQVFMEQGNFNDAQKISWHVSQTRERDLGYEHEDTLYAAACLARAIFSQGKHGEAEPLIRRLYEAAPRILRPDHPISLGIKNMMSVLAWKLGNKQERERLAREILQISLQTYGPRHEKSITAMYRLSRPLDADERETICRRALDICKNGGEGLQDVEILAARELASALKFQDRDEESLKLLRDVWKRSRDLYGPDHHRTLGCQSEICYGLIYVKKFDDAEKLSRETYLKYRKVRGHDTAYSLDTIRAYALALVNLKRYIEAEQLYIKIIGALEKLSGKFHSDTVGVIEELGDLYKEQRRFDDWVALHTQKHQEFEGAGIESTPRLRILFLLAKALYKAERFDDAAVYFRKLIDGQIRLGGETDNDTLKYYEWLGGCYASLKQWDQLLKLYQDKHEQLQRSAVENKHTLRIRYRFAKALKVTGQYEESEKYFLNLLDRQEKVLGIAHDAVMKTYESLGDCYSRVKRYGKKISLYQAKLDQLRAFAMDEKQTLRIWSLLGAALYSAGRLEEAEACLKPLIEVQEKVLGTADKATITSYECLGDCYHKAKRFDIQVAHYQQKHDKLLPLGVETEQSLRILFLLAWSLYEAKKYLEAGTHFEALIEKQEQILKPTHKHTLRSYKWLEKCYSKQERYSDIFYLCEKKITLFQSINANDEAIWMLIVNFSKILYRAKYTRYTTDLLQPAIAKLEELFGPDHLEKLKAMVLLGWCHESRRQYAAALAVYEPALEGLVRLKAAGKETNEDLVELLGKDIPKMKEHVANGEGLEGSSDEQDSEEDSEEEGDACGSEMAWEPYADLDELEELVPVEMLMF